MKRRDAIKAALLLSSTAILQGSFSTPAAFANTLFAKQKTDKEADVIVIGAGASGLAAARTLHDAGKKVIILEARNRLGGRVWSNRAWPDATLDMGASWIHGIDNNPLVDLARKYKIKTVETDFEALAIHNTDGKLLSENQTAEVQALLHKFEHEIARLQKNYESEDRDDISLQSALDIILTKLNLSPNEIIQLNYAINGVIEHEYAADISQLSLYYWNDDGESFDGMDVLFPNGYDQILQNLATELDLRLEHVVKKISYNPEGVIVSTSNGEFSADAVVVTLPLGVLKKNSVEFSPPLPKSKHRAIEQLGMGVLNKLYLRFDQRFWENEADVMGYLAANKGEWTEWINMSKAVDHPILLAFNAGTYGTKIESFKDDQIVAEAMKTIRTMYGSNIPNPQAHLISRWRSDPFAFGSYSYRAVNATSDDHDLLAESVADRLFFAGEATSRDNSATVHGAYLSGIRAAEEILGD